MHRHKLGTEKSQINSGQVAVLADMNMADLMKQGGTACMSEKPVKSTCQ